uniref:Uncharacterized protein n=1 Tax=Cucumis melo TaxID=3656 RepID=A0A9I9EIU4_CUCME
MAKNQRLIYIHRLFHLWAKTLMAKGLEPLFQSILISFLTIMIYKTVTVKIPNFLVNSFVEASINTLLSTSNHRIHPILAELSFQPLLKALKSDHRIEKRLEHWDEQVATMMFDTCIDDINTKYMHGCLCETHHSNVVLKHGHCDFQIIYEHVVIKGIDPTYNFWYHHGVCEGDEVENEVDESFMFEAPNFYERTYIGEEDNIHDYSTSRKENNFSQKIEEANMPLYGSCTKCTKMSVVVALCFHHGLNPSLEQGAPPSHWPEKDSVGLKEQDVISGVK